MTDDEHAFYDQPENQEPQGPVRSRVTVGHVGTPDEHKTVERIAAEVIVRNRIENRQGTPELDAVDIVDTLIAGGFMTTAVWPGVKEDSDEERLG